MWSFSHTQFVVWLVFEGSPDSFTPTGRHEPRAFVMQSLAEFQIEMDLQRTMQIHVVSPVKEGQGWDQCCQHEILTCESG